MQERGFEGIHQAEGSWYYRSRSFAIQRMLSKFKVKNENICEVGAGYGAMCETLRPFGKVTAFEPDESARKECMDKCDIVFPGSDLSELVREKKGQFTVVTILDVIEHVENDMKFAQDLRELLAPGGHMLITVPAYQWMWSELDVVAMHFRRYSKADIVSVLEKAGFEIEYASYWNAMLLIPASMVRVGTGKAGYSAFSMPKAIDAIFFYWVKLETLLMPYIPLPFGTSVFIYARKK